MTVGTPTLWAITLAAVLGLVAVDFLLTRRPHEVSLREAALWSSFYIALPLGFVDVKVCAVDATWSGLKLVVRKALRA